LCSSGAYRFHAITGQALNQRLQTCRDLQQQNIINLQPLQSQLTEAYGLSQCPDNPAAIISECGDSVPCQYDYTTLNAKVMGVKIKEEWNVFTTERIDATRFCKYQWSIHVIFSLFCIFTPLVRLMACVYNPPELRVFFFRFTSQFSRTVHVIIELYSVAIFHAYHGPVQTGSSHLSPLPR
ncbi:hypothetical protein COOONC_19303, partial [Cooperia oncophora]